jgi:hypothetical protein
VLDNAVDEGRKLFSVAERALVDVVENGGQLGIELVLRVQMCVAEVLDVLGEVAEEEDVLLADFTGDFDLVGGQLIPLHRQAWQHLHSRHRTCR